MAKAMQQAMIEAGVNPSEIDYVNAHATGTLQGDTAEAIAIGNVVGAVPPGKLF